MSNLTASTTDLVRNPGKYLDWRAWWLGLYSNSITAGATAITTWFSTNGVEGALGSIPALHNAVAGVGMGWKTALAQFAVHVVYAAAKYISDTKGMPTPQTNPPIAPAT